ncbi:MAG: hypothetical protein P8M22_12000, partial [Phycisphaerales bacterium]|nr:hypothetical protein [Phycisphaerales bacterium]
MATTRAPIARTPNGTINRSLRLTRGLMPVLEGDGTTASPTFQEAVAQPVVQLGYRVDLPGNRFDVV